MKICFKFLGCFSIECCFPVLLQKPNPIVLFVLYLRIGNFLQYLCNPSKSASVIRDKSYIFKNERKKCYLLTDEILILCIIFRMIP